MKKSTLTILIVLCIIAGAAGWFAKYKREATWHAHTIGIGQKLFPDLVVSEVDKMVVKTRNDELTMSRRDGIWVVDNANGYPADFSKVGQFLVDLAELTPIQMVDVAPDDLGKLELAPPDAESGTGTEVTLFTSGKTVAAKILIGQEHTRKMDSPTPWGGSGYPDGRYLLLPEAQEVYLVSKTFTNVTDNKDDWMDKAFLRAGTARHVVAMKGDETLWELSRETTSGSLTLQGDLPEDMEPDTSKISSVGSAFSYPTFNRVTPSAEAEGLGFDEVNRSYQVETFDGFTYTAEIGKKADDGTTPVRFSVAYAAPEAPPPPDNETPSERDKREKDWQKKLDDARLKFDREKQLYAAWIYFLPSYTADNLMAERDDLMKKVEKKEEEKPADAPAAAPADGNAAEEPAGNEE